MQNVIVLYPKQIPSPPVERSPIIESVPVGENFTDILDSYGRVKSTLVKQQTLSDLTAAYRSFKRLVQVALRVHEQEIADLRQHLKKLDDVNESRGEGILIILEENNKRLCWELETYKIKNAIHWDDFKRSFHQGLVQIGMALAILSKQTYKNTIS